MSTPHSPLPWAVALTSDEQAIVYSEHPSIDTAMPIAYVYGPDAAKRGEDTRACEQANAAYIVEACNRYGLLLDALQKIAKATEYSSGVFVAIHETARAALEGVTPPSLVMDSAKDKSVPPSGDGPCSTFLFQAAIKCPNCHGVGNFEEVTESPFSECDTCLGIGVLYRRKNKPTASDKEEIIRAAAQRITDSADAKGTPSGDSPGSEVQR